MLCIFEQCGMSRSSPRHTYSAMEIVDSRCGGNRIYSMCHSGSKHTCDVMSRAGRVQM